MAKQKNKNNHKQETADRSQSGSNTVSADVNVGNMERLAAVIGGGALLLYCLRKVSLADIALTVAGGSLLYKGMTDRSVNADPTEGVRRVTEEIQDLTGRAKGWAQGWAQELKTKVRERLRMGAEPILVERSIVINKSPEGLYAFWRDFENLPKIMSYLESVTNSRGKRSHWVAKGPADLPIEWDAEITEDKKNEMISWRALEDADVPNEGSVYFERTSEGGTELRVLMEYTLPGGKIGAAIAEFFGEDPSQKIEEDLNNFKEAVEGGEIELETETAPSPGVSEGGA